MTYQTNKYITRCESSHCDGWNVRIPESEQNKSNLTTRFFSRQQYNGIRNAKNVAKEWRDKELKKRGLFYLMYRKRASQGRIRSSANTSGIIGIAKRETHWVANYTWEGKQYAKRFYIKKLGDRPAFIEACKIRYH
jgi:hypothetical protein